MFEHIGIRPLWPVVLFLPWFLVGVAYLVRPLAVRLQALEVRAGRIDRLSRHSLREGSGGC
jgi:hypothetical protein